MRNGLWLMFVLGASANAAPPACCRLFDFDATPMLGPHPVMCGKIVDGDLPADAELATQQERKRATACALEAQSQGKAFVYTYRFLVSPHIDLIVQGVFGAHGERMLFKIGKFNRENVRTIEVCDALTVEPDGKLRDSGCYGGW